MKIFKPEEKIIEQSLLSNQSHLSDQTISVFTDELSRNTPAPGGGSVSALVASLSCALISMVSNITAENRNYLKYRKRLIEIGNEMQKMKDQLNDLIDRDSKAFYLIMDAFKLPKKNATQSQIREAEIENATKKAIETPLEILYHCYTIINYSDYLVNRSNPNCISDLGVAINNIKSAAYGAFLNIVINLKDMKNNKYKKDTYENASSIIKKINNKYLSINSKIEKVMGIS